MSVIRCGRCRLTASCRMLRNGVIPIPPAMNTTGREASAWRPKVPAGPERSTGVPSGISARLRLNAVPVMRVVITRRLVSWGGEAMENTRRLPSASVCGGLGRTMITNWPALNSKPVGRSSANAMVPSATSVRSISGVISLGMVASDGDGVGMKLLVLRIPCPHRTYRKTRGFSTVLFADWKACRSERGAAPRGRCVRDRRGGAGFAPSLGEVAFWDARGSPDRPPVAGRLVTTKVGRLSLRRWMDPEDVPKRWRSSPSLRIGHSGRKWETRNLPGRKTRISRWTSFITARWSRPSGMPSHSPQRTLISYPNVPTQRGAPPPRSAAPELGIASGGCPQRPPPPPHHDPEWPGLRVPPPACSGCPADPVRGRKTRCSILAGVHWVPPG